jgi:diphthine synthase
VTAAAGLLGLQSYKFGRTTTLAIPQENYFPLSPYAVIQANMDQELHTLVLLDIQDKVFMTAAQAVDILIEMEKRLGEGVITDRTLLAAVARVSSPSPILKAGYPQTLKNTNLGPPLHSLVIPGKLHMMEAKALVMLADAPSDILSA